MGDIGAKVRSFGWNVFEINGHNIHEISETIQKAKNKKDGPNLIIALSILPARAIPTATPRP